MGWFRSAEMAYVAFQFNKDAAHRTVERLGKLGSVQFVDKNAGTVAFNRTFTEPIRRCDELERRLRFFEEEMSRHGIDADKTAARSSASEGEATASSSSDLLQELDTELAARERDLNGWLSSLSQLRRERNRQCEQIEVLKFGREFLRWSDDAEQFGAEHDGDGGMGDSNSAEGGGGGGFFGGRTRKGSKERSLLGDASGLESGSSGMGSVVQRVGGVVRSELKDKMSRMLFRVSRGNALVVFDEIEEPMLEGAEHAAAAVSKHAFVVVVSSEVLERKVLKVMEAFDANRYDLPENVGECERLLAEGRAQHDEQRELVERNGTALRAALLTLSSETGGWRRAVRREKAIYHTLNLFRAPDDGGRGGGAAASGMLDAPQLDGGGSSRFEAEGWVVAAALPAVRQVVLDAHREMPSVVEIVPPSGRGGAGLPPPPTHFALNKFSRGFQALVDTYGVPRYREANPALFTAVTFPFLFGVMYGDVGHGACLLLFGLALVLGEKGREGRPLGELEGGLHLARYMILMMGVFAVYCGFIYNDFFGLGLDLGAGSRWTYEWTGCDKHTNMKKCIDQADDTSRKLCEWLPHGECVASVGTTSIPVSHGHPQTSDDSDDTLRSGCDWYIPKGKNASQLVNDGASCPAGGNVYPFGLDPMWHTASNELLMANSLKMKMSVILGITQMVGGILLKGANCLHVGDRVSFFLDFVPQLVFACALFVYMIVLIIVKWGIDWNHRMSLVNPALNMACPSELGGCQPPNLITTLINIVLKIGDVADPMYEGQAGVQTFLVLMCVLSVPIMLLGKPLYLRWENERNPRVATLAGGGDDDHGGGGIDDTETSFVRHGSDADEHEPAAGGGHGHGPFNFGEVMIHQGIETIEFVLGMVSNTASYLRLWALSLAHTELAGVFWHKVMLTAINTKNPFFIFIAFTIFAAITTAVLLMMDVLECFLHALRLHWVEFQNKFFAADGHKFVPLDFAALDKEAL